MTGNPPLAPSFNSKTLSTNLQPPERFKNLHTIAQASQGAEIYPSEKHRTFCAFAFLFPPPPQLVPTLPIPHPLLNQICHFSTRNQEPRHIVCCKLWFGMEGRYLAYVRAGSWIHTPYWVGGVWTPPPKKKQQQITPVPHSIFIPTRIPSLLLPYPLNSFFLCIKLLISCSIRHSERNAEAGSRDNGGSKNVCLILRHGDIGEVLF